MIDKLNNSSSSKNVLRKSISKSSDSTKDFVELTGEKHDEAKEVAKEFGNTLNAVAKQITESKESKSELQHELSHSDSVKDTSQDEHIDANIDMKELNEMFTKNAIILLKEKNIYNESNLSELTNLVKNMFTEMISLKPEDLHVFRSTEKIKILQDPEKNTKLIKIMNTIDSLETLGLNAGPKSGETLALWQGDPARIYIESGDINKDYQKELDQEQSQNTSSSLETSKSTNQKELTEFISDSKLNFQNILFSVGRDLTEKYKTTEKKDSYKNFLDKAQGFASCYLAKKCAKQDTVRVYLSNNTLENQRYFFSQELPTLRNEKNDVKVEYYVKNSETNTFEEKEYFQLEIASNRYAKTSSYEPEDETTFLNTLIALNNTDSEFSSTEDITKAKLPIAINDSVCTLDSYSFKDDTFKLILNDGNNDKRTLTFVKKDDKFIYDSDSKRVKRVIKHLDTQSKLLAMLDE